MQPESACTCECGRKKTLYPREYLHLQILPPSENLQKQKKINPLNCQWRQIMDRQQQRKRHTQPTCESTNSPGQQQTYQKNHTSLPAKLSAPFLVIFAITTNSQDGIHHSNAESTTTQHPTTHITSHLASCTIAFPFLLPKLRRSVSSICSRVRHKKTSSRCRHRVACSLNKQTATPNNSEHQ